MKLITQNSCCEATPRRVRLKTNQGFTLIELLIVVAIIGLLASVVLVGLGGFRARGRDARRIADLRETQNALELYYTKNNKYPSISGIDTWESLKTSLIGAGIGAAGSTAYQLATKGPSVRIPAQTKLDFKLRDAVTITLPPKEQ